MRPATERSALELAGAIRAGELSARAVLEAHIERHRLMAPAINAVVADRYDAALAEADAADRRVAQAGDAGALPPLLGVPFTVKESISVAGMPHSAGLVARGKLRAERTAPAVARLIDGGGIVLGVSNTSELTLWIESANRLYGRTSNPYDPARSAGGSSGGEGAAVGCGGSPFGVASDIAGSIRIPASFCGAFGHKPSAGIVPNSGMFPPSPGKSGRMLAVGTLARRAEDLMPLLRLMAGPDGEDEQVREAVLGNPDSVTLSGLTVAAVEDASVWPVSREVREARERALGALAGAGAEVRRVQLRSWRGALMPFLMTLQAGSAQTTLELLEAAGVTRPTWRSLLSGGGPHVLATRLALAAEMLPRSRGRALERQLQAGRRLAEEVVETIGDGVLLHPAFPRVAPRHGGTVGRLWLLVSAAIFNLAGVPVSEVPLGLNESGLPLGVQVAAGPDRDHVAIAVAQALERAFGGWRAPPLPPP